MHSANFHIVHAIAQRHLAVSSNKTKFTLYRAHAAYDGRYWHCGNLGTVPNT